MLNASTMQVKQPFRQDRGKFRPFEFPLKPPFNHTTRAHSKRRLRGLNLSKGGANLTFQCSKIKRAQRTARAFCAALPATSRLRSAHTAAAAGSTPTTHAPSFLSRAPLVRLSGQPKLKVRLAAAMKIVTMTKFYKELNSMPFISNEC